MKLPLTGGCLCSAIRYEITEPPKRMGYCHCRTCQQATGSAYFPFIATSANALHIQGEPTWYESMGDTGNKVSRGFCSKCGSRLFSKPAALPELRTISATSLDNPLLFKPEIAVWLNDALPWHSMDSTLIKFDKNSTVFKKQA